MAINIARDDFDWEKRGRVLSDSQARAAIGLRAKNLLQPGRTARAPGADRVEANSGGNQAAAGNAGKGRAPTRRSRETVLKVIGWSKSAYAGPNQALYIARERETDRKPESGSPVPRIALENEDGRQITGREDIEVELKSWGLDSASANRSAAWRQASPEDRRAMSVNDALSRRQTAHLLFSIPATSSLDHKALEAGVRAGLADTLGQQGFRYVFAIHTDHSARPHAHIIVKARSEQIASDRRTARQLRLGPRELQALRQTFTAEVQARGLDVVATQRADRSETRAQIRKGQAPLRENATQGKRWADGRSRQGSTFEAKAPTWYAAYGLEYERRRLDEFAPKEEGKGLLRRLHAALQRKGAEDRPWQPSEPKRPSSAALARLDRHFSQTHRGPVEARESFLSMYLEAPKLAVWAANNHPIAFGAATGQTADRALTGRGLKSVLQAEVQPSALQPRTKSSEKLQEARDIRQRHKTKSAQRRAQRDAEGAARSLERFASRLEAESANPGAADQAEQIRKLAVDSKAGKQAELEARSRRRAQTLNRGREISSER